MLKFKILNRWNLQYSFQSCTTKSFSLKSNLECLHVHKKSPAKKSELIQISANQVQINQTKLISLPNNEHKISSSGNPITAHISLA